MLWEDWRFVLPWRKLGIRAFFHYVLFAFLWIRRGVICWVEKEEVPATNGAETDLPFNSGKREMNFIALQQLATLSKEEPIMGVIRTISIPSTKVDFLPRESRGSDPSFPPLPEETMTEIGAQIFSKKTSPVWRKFRERNNWTSFFLPVQLKPSWNFGS